MKDYICEVSGEDAEGPDRIIRVNAPSEDVAILLAFAMDGGLGAETEDVSVPAQEYDSMLALARSYVTARLVDDGA